MALQTREKRLLIALAITAIVSAGILYDVLYSKDTAPVPSSPATKKPTETTPAAPSASRGNTSARTTTGGGAGTPGSVSPESFQRHSQLNDCWVLIDGVVYDITEFLRMSPEYQDSASEYCGTIGFEAGFLGNDEALTELVTDQSLKRGPIGA